MNAFAPSRTASRIRVLACAGMAAMALLVGCRIDAATAEGTLTATAAEAKSLLVTNANGSVEIVKDPSATTMQVAAAIRCVAESKEAAEARVKATKLVADRGADGRVHVKVVFPRRAPDVVHVRVGWVGSQDSVSLQIRAAQLDGIEVSTSNGSIVSGAFVGAAKLRTSNGSIQVDGHAGSVDMDTSNGSITAMRVGTPVVADTSNGRIEVSLAEAATGDVNLDTSNGRVELALPAAWQGTVHAETSNAAVETNMTSGTLAKVKSDDGEATITIGDGTRAKATIKTSNGRIGIRAPGN
jgi:DUF4097 and DUF4098 domain-containing protein YvlB